MPSHFNNATSLDEGLFIMGGVAIAATLLVVVAMAVAAVARTTAPPPLALAIRAGRPGGRQAGDESPFAGRRYRAAIPSLQDVAA